MRKKLLVVSVVMLLLVLLVSPNTLAAKKKVIGMSQSMLAGNPWWDVMTNAVKSELEKLGYEVIVLDAEGNVSKQVADVEDLIARGVDLIALNPYDSYAVVPVTLKAQKAGIPVIAVDIPVAPDGYSITTVIANNYQLGYENGWYMAQLAKKVHVKAVIISGYPGAICSSDRLNGFLAGFNRYQIDKHNHANLEIIFHSYGDYAFTPAYDIMKDVITRTNGDFDVVFCANDAMAIGALKALEDANIKGKLIAGVDGYREMYEMIMAGKTHSTGLNSPYELGIKTAETIVKILNGEHVPSNVYTTPVLINKDNVKKYYNPNQDY
jgi:ribose transport system substrate-binding protein